MKWLYKLEEDYKCNLEDYISHTELCQLKTEIQEDIDFCDNSSPQVRRLRITKEGEVIVFRNYNWDGNSPKFNVFDLFWLGTPDGIITQNKPITYYASLIHDVLGQFKKHPRMPSKFRSDQSPDLWLSKGRIGRDGLYFSILKKKEFILRHVYYLAVALAGPLYDTYLAIIKKVNF